MSRRRIVGIFVMDSVHYLCITRLFGEFLGRTIEVRVMLTRPWYAPYIIEDNDLVSQNVGFGPSSRLPKVELVGCTRKWIS